MKGKSNKAAWILFAIACVIIAILITTVWYQANEVFAVKYQRDQLCGLYNNLTLLTNQCTDVLGQANGMQYQQMSQFDCDNLNN